MRAQYVSSYHVIHVPMVGGGGGAKINLPSPIKKKNPGVAPLPQQFTEYAPALKMKILHEREHPRINCNLLPRQISYLCLDTQ